LDRSIDIYGYELYITHFFLKITRFAYPVEINVPVTDPYITVEGLSICLGHLYGSFSQAMFVRSISEMAANEAPCSVILKSVLASASLLGMGDLALMATEMIKADVGTRTIMDYCQFVSSVTNETAVNYVEDIRNCVFGYLCKGIVHDIAETHGAVWVDRQGSGYLQLVSAYACLPFEWLKKIVESKMFEVSSDMER
jgi:hypothetical protein